MAQSYVVTIEKPIFGGDALGHLPDGRAVFVPFVLPQEEVLVALVQDKPRYARGIPVEIIKPSPLRIDAKCPHFATCGGCHYQHISYASQLETKQTVLIDQLARIGKINTPPLSKIVPCESPWNYRNHIQFHQGKDGKPGFIDVTGTHILPIQECHLPQDTINNIWPQINLEANSGIHRLGLRQDSNEEIMLVLEGQDETAPEFSLDLSISAAYLSPEGFLTNLAGEDALYYRIKDRLLRVSPESFFQVNLAQAEKMLDFVLASLPTAETKPEILELYSGVGFFSTFLAERASQLTAVEASRSACFDFAINLDAFDNVSLYEAAVEDTLPALNLKPDIIILDPPRSGLDKKARKSLLALESPFIIYVSCDPATLSRDLRHFIEADYQLKEIKAFDLFPQTYHIESISLLQRK